MTHHEPPPRRKRLPGWWILIPMWVFLIAGNAFTMYRLAGGE